MELINSVLFYYSLFALTTAITAHYEIISVVMKNLRQLDAKILESKWLLHMVLFTVSLVFAPLVFFACIIPPFSQSVIKGLTTSLSEEI